MESFLAEMGGSTDRGKSLAALFFYGFFLPHEVGHALQYHTNKVPKNAYDGEYEANELAVLYWRSKRRDKELQQCIEMAKKILMKLNNPVPENAEAKKYITEHYDELLKDPYKYAFIQFSKIVKILDDRSLPDFDTYIKKYFTKIKNCRAFCIADGNLLNIELWNVVNFFYHHC